MYDPKGIPLVKRVKTKPNRPLLYQDIDGCLFGTYDGAFQLRPGVSSYLKWACTHFEVRWLTCWSDVEVAWLLRMLYISEKRLGVPMPVYQHWDQCEHKHDAIDWDADFYWMDDAPEYADLGALKSRGKMNRLIRCDSVGENGLLKARNELEAILAARESAA